MLPTAARNVKERNMKTNLIEATQILSSEEGRTLSIGAQTLLQSIFQAPECPEPLIQALGADFNWQFRNEVTVERSILAPGLAPRWIASLLTWGAEVFFQDEGQKSELADYLLRTGSHPSKIAAIHLPLKVPGRRWGQVGIGRTPADAPIVSSWAVVDLTEGVVREARLALTGVWREPTRLAKSAKLLVGQILNAESIQQVSSAVANEVNPKGNFLGSIEYRQAMADVLTRLALGICMEASK